MGKQGQKPGITAECEEIRTLSGVNTGRIRGKHGQDLGKTRADLGKTWAGSGQPTWDPCKSRVQNPDGAHMGCPDGAHIVAHMGPIWDPYVCASWVDLKLYI